jgi:hypothetical protein
MKQLVHQSLTKKTGQSELYKKVETRKIRLDTKQLWAFLMHKPGRLKRQIQK